MRSEIIKFLPSPENYIFGFADLAGLPIDPGYRFGIVLGRRLDYKIIGAIINGPTLEYFNHYNEVNKELSEVVHSVNKWLISKGYECKVVEPSIGEETETDEVYKKTLRAPVSHKMIATRTGLGWIGKTDLLISKKFGPRLRFASLLTNYPLEITNSPIVKSQCGICDLCVINCPAQAATGLLWDVNTDRDLFFDAFKCQDKCKELTKSLLNIKSTICGICVSVCPVGK